MSVDTIPNQTYFNGLIYNPNFYSSGNTITLTYATQNFLKRTGNNPTSNAVLTSFSGNVAVNGLSTISNVSIGGNASITGNVSVSGTTTTTNVITNNIDVAISNTDAYLFPSAYGIYIGSNENTITYIKCYFDCLQYATFRTGLTSYDTSILFGITNNDNPLQNNLTTDASSLTSSASTIINGGMIIKKNLYATDVMSNNISTGNVGCGNLNSSNTVSCPKVICNNVNCNTITANDVFYKNKICGYINIGIAPYLKIPLTTSLIDTTTSILNLDLSTLLINANNNTLFLLPNYTLIFYSNETILLIIENNDLTKPILYQNIQFERSLICTKIIIQYKNLTLL